MGNINKMLLITVKKIIKAVVAAIRLPFEVITINYVKKNLTWGVIKGKNECQDDVSYDLELPVYYKNVCISWTSIPGMIDKNGKVVQQNDIDNVRVEAILYKKYRYINEYSLYRAKKYFHVSIKGKSVEELGIDEYLNENILKENNSDLNHVKSKLYLPKLVCGINIEWRSTDEKTVSKQGIVHRNNYDKSVDLLAEGFSTKGNLVFSKQFEVTVLKRESNDKILIMVPHGDDELFLAADVIYSNEQKGNEVWVCFYTYNDHKGESYALERTQEATKALNTLGVDKGNILYLGYSNSWSGKHIYYGGKDEIVISIIGKSETYCVGAFNDFRYLLSGEHSKYSRDNIKKDIKDLIVYVNPSAIYAIDVDKHEDHIAYSQLFDESIGEMLREGRYDFSRCNIMKGFAYVDSAYSIKDDFTLNTRYRKNRLRDSKYVWKDRIQVKTNPMLLCMDSEKNAGIQALLYYGRMYDSVARFISADSVYWEKNLKGSLSNHDLTVSSGNSRYLNDCLINDYSNLKYGIIDRKAFWSPDKSDKKRSVSFVANGITFNYIRIYSIKDYLYRPKKCEIIIDGKKLVWRNLNFMLKPYYDIYVGIHQNVSVEIIFKTSKLKIGEIELKLLDNKKKDKEKCYSCGKTYNASKEVWIFNRRIY